MNYKQIYKRIIKNAKNKNRKKYPTKHPKYQYFENHHIIPRVLCKGKPWMNNKVNLVLLTAREHYICHQLLVKIFPNNPNLIYTCFWFANKKQGEHINSKMYQWVKELYAKIHGNNMSIKYKGKAVSKAALDACKLWRKQHASELSLAMQGKNNIVHKEGVIDKIRKKKKNTYIDGKNIDTIAAERAAQTMKKEYINEQGQITTIYKEIGKKNSKYWNELVTVDGETLSRIQLRNRKNQQTQRNNGKWYLVKNVFDLTFQKELCASEVRKISPGLPSKNKDNYLGKSKDGKTKLIKQGKKELIGLYCILIKDSSTKRNKNMEQKEQKKKYNRIIKNPWIKIFNNNELIEILPKEVVIKKYGKSFCNCTQEKPYGVIKTVNRRRLKNIELIGYYCQEDIYENIKHLIQLENFV